MKRSVVRIIAYVMIATSVLLVPIHGHAVDYPPQPAPQMLEISRTNDYEPAIGHNEFDGYYADFKWSPLAKPNPPDYADRQYIDFYIQKVSKAYRPSMGLELKEQGIPGTETKLRMANLESGTVYYAYAVAYYSDIEEGQVVYTSARSLPSNTVKFLTDIEITAAPSGPNEITIIWDDVWNSGGRIDYKLYISESSDFSNTPPIYITEDLIGPGRPVTVNETTGKLVYKFRVPDPGRVYYIKIDPDVLDENLKMPDQSRIVPVSSYIIARIMKMAANELGTIWRLDWTPVITGLDASQVNISYHIYRGITGTSELPQYVAQTDETSFFITVQDSDPDYYFIIRAMITINGQDLYPGIKIESMPIEVKESEIPYTPAAPEIIDRVLDNYGMEITSYEVELKPNSATIFWNPPRRGTGEIDTDILYDIWLLTDPSEIDQPPELSRIETSLKIGAGRYVVDGSVIKAYKYVVGGLAPNNVYYFRIQARKEFVDYVDGVLQQVIYVSEPSIKVIITPTDGPIEQPVVPGRPPLTVKRGPLPDERPMVSSDSAVISLKNKWYEKFDSEERRWVFITPEELDTIDDTLVDKLENGEYQGNEYRIVEYDSGVTLDIGCIPYDGSINPEDLALIPANWVTGFPTVANDPNEDPAENPDGKRHNIDIAISGLKPNTTYIVWARASRQSAGLVSGPSDPVVFTTDPEIIVLPEKPIVPEFNYYYPGDTYVELGWDFREGYNYYIRYSRTDNLAGASASLTITSGELAALTHYTVTGLEPDTIYYFWIQAETVSPGGVRTTSEWSSSLIVRTLPYEPPETPSGFGIRSGNDAVTEHSISYEWVTKEGLEYILEVADNIDYKNSTDYQAGSSSTYTVEGLQPNRRYYARLYAYDPVKRLRSKPTLSIAVRTLKSGEEYDADEDTETVPTGDIIQKDRTAYMGIWTINITGINADRFIEKAMADKLDDIMIDASTPPPGTQSIRLLASGDIFEALSNTGKALVINTSNADYVIRPGSLGNVRKRLVEIVIVPEKKQISLPTYLTPSGKPTEFSVRTVAGNGSYVGAEMFAVPVRVVFTGKNYSVGLTGMFFEPLQNVWEERELSYGVDGYTLENGVAMDINMPGVSVLGIKNRDIYIDIAANKYRSSINNIAGKYNLKSVGSSRFRPADEITQDEAVKLIFDVINAGYGRDASVSAVKAGILNINDMGRGHLACTREKAIDIVVRVYELLSGVDVSGDPGSIRIFNDMSSVSTDMAANVAFAIDNGLVPGNSSKSLFPKEKITRGEFMFLLERCLELVQAG